MSKTIVNDLGRELVALEGLHGQHPESGAGIDEGNTYIDKYTNRLFGAPYQFLDSVDKRFTDINSYVGVEYLKNFLLDAPILHIKPGLPKYTGGNDTTSIVSGIQNIYMDTSIGDMSLVSSLLNQLASSTIFGGGSKLQKRMYGFRECYYDYMQHVNYMCRSEAVFLNLTEGANIPTSGTFNSSNQWGSFSTFKWQNYRMMAGNNVMKPSEYLAAIGESSIVDAVRTAGGTVSGLSKLFLSGVLGLVEGSITDQYNLTSCLASSGLNSLTDAWDESSKSSVSSRLADKITSVEFMVEPVAFSEDLQNETSQSMIESAIDAISSDVGSEISFITNSNADVGMLEDITSVLGSSLETASSALSNLASSFTGGFTSNLFSGAINSLKGQKMIYPDIYKKSNSTMDYTFSVTLTTPYGDPYNYYMNIIVPLMHLIALASPRMVTSNTTTSPFLVQAYIPGMCTCGLGIISNMSIQKNPNANHVSIHGFPLTVKVNFTIKELYNAMAISPANDPSSFLFNETLNDYMSNMAGLAPSVDTYTKQRQNAFSNLQQYLTSGDWAEDIINKITVKIEDMYNPFTGR